MTSQLQSSLIMWDNLQAGGRRCLEAAIKDGVSVQTSTSVAAVKVWILNTFLLLLAVWGIES